MPLTIKHTFVSPKLDSSDPTIVRPSAWNDEHLVTGGGFMLAGTVIDFVGVSWPSYMLECYGQSVSSTTYPLLFDAMVKQFTITFTLGTPGIVNWASHNIPINGKVRFRITTGTLPTGITAGTDYYVLSTGYSANTFQISATVGGVAIALSGGSGTYTGIHAPYGVATDLSTFSIPDLRGRVTAGLDIMGGADANRLTGVAGSVNGAVLGAVGGAETAAAELPAHTHAIDPPSTAVAVTVNSGGAHTHTVTGTISTVADHTHSGSGGTIGSGGSHAHAISALSVSTAAAHGHTDTFAATVSIVANGAHTHVLYDRGFYFEISDPILGGGGKSSVQPTTEGGGSGIPIGTTTDGSHTHTGTVAITGAVAAGGAHTHTLVSGSTDTEAGHTHSLSGMSIAAAGTHNHTFSSGVAASDGAHTHVASGTVDIASFTSGSAGSGTGHNNVQPTFIIRKLIFVG